MRFLYPAPAGGLLVRSAIALALAGTLAGCVTDRDATGSIRGQAASSQAAVPREAASLQAYTDDWGRRYEANHTDKTAALNYASGLRALDRNPQAVAVLETAAIKYPYDPAVLSAYGKTLANVGRLKEAAEVLPRAHTPDRPDWSVLSAQGSVADQLGDHAAAQGYYQAALKIAPDSPTTLSNLGLSYALDKRLPEAEATLRRAAALPETTARVRQNLAFVLALQGKDAEAETVARADLSPDDAAQSVAAVKAMVANANAPRSNARTRRPALAGGTAG